MVLHVDDLGMCHSSNAAFLDLTVQGLVTCGSVMVPCPWFPELVAANDRLDLDLGVHLTLTSEWAQYRWRPISTLSLASGLIDDDGYFHRDLQNFSRNLVPEAAEAEMVAQVERAFSSGLRPTHIDAHMGVALLPQLVESYVRLALGYGLIPVLPRGYGGSSQYESAVALVREAGVPVVDQFVGTQWTADDPVEPTYQEVIRKLPVGLTHFALHATKPGAEIISFAPDHAARTREYELLAMGAIARCCAENGVGLGGYRALQRWPEFAR
ncbi:MAG: polysaccharide deacetylase family protein [Xanthobacteraceae bacterium]|nr:polysaccharide deacetylase family protein [Xanthobacteraceae bacterium]